MKLILSDEGKTISGTATFKSGNWTDPIDYKRVHLASPSVDLGPGLTRRKTFKFEAAAGFSARFIDGATEKFDPASKRTDLD